MTRLRHIGCKTAALGLSGGLDSTLALIVTVHAFDMLGLGRNGIHTITMPCFGTTDRTYTNACELTRRLNPPGKIQRSRPGRLNPQGLKGPEDQKNPNNIIIEAFR